MANNFNADTTDGLKILADTSGTFNFQSAGTTVTSITANGIDVTGDLTVDTNTLYVDSTNNRVGIGTSNPSSPLSVAYSNNTANPQLDSDVGLVVRNIGTSNVSSLKLTDLNGSLVWGDGSDVGGYLTFRDRNASAERMRIDSSGNVGIGTSNPLHRLHVEGGNMYLDTAGYSQIYQRDSAARDFIKLYDETGTVQWRYVHTSDDHLVHQRISAGQWVKGTPMTFIGEHNGATAVGEYFSLGNGSTNSQGPAMPFAGKIIAATISKTGGSSSGTFTLHINGSGVSGANMTTTTGTGSVSAGTNLNISFSANDRINWYCSNASDTTVVLAFWVIFE